MEHEEVKLTKSRTRNLYQVQMGLVDMLFKLCRGAMLIVQALFNFTYHNIFLKKLLEVRIYD